MADADWRRRWRSCGQELLGRAEARPVVRAWESSGRSLRPSRRSRLERRARVALGKAAGTRRGGRRRLAAPGLHRSSCASIPGAGRERDRSERTSIESSARRTAVRVPSASRRDLDGASGGGGAESVLTLPASVRSTFAAEAVDLRRGFDGWPRDPGADRADPLSGHVFVFLNAREPISCSCGRTGTCFSTSVSSGARSRTTQPWRPSARGAGFRRAGVDARGLDLRGARRRTRYRRSSRSAEEGTMTAASLCARQ